MVRRTHLRGAVVEVVLAALCAAAGTTERVSVSSSGAQANGASFAPSLSADGRFVAFMSRASNLVADDTNQTNDIFVYDRLTGRTVRVSVISDGGEAARPSYHPAISADGTCVAFLSAAKLAPEDRNGSEDVFVHDRIGPPDLEALELEAPPSTRQGDTVDLAWSGRNREGAGPMPWAWTDVVYLSRDDVLDDGDVLLCALACEDVAPLGPNQSYTRSARATVPLDLPVGSWFAILNVNGEGTHCETDSGNNVILRSIRVLWSGLHGDVDNDGCVNVSDLLAVRVCLGETGSGITVPRSDVDCNGIVNVSDLVAVRVALGQGCE